MEHGRIVETPAPGTGYAGAFSCGGMVVVCLSLYFYGDGAAAARDGAAWQAWINQHFPMPSMG